MQKPEKKSIRDFITERVSEELSVHPDIIDTVIGWSYKKANQATHNHKEVEISGIGKLQLSQAKLRKNLITLERIESYLEEDNPKLEPIKERIKELKSRQDV